MKIKIAGYKVPVNKITNLVAKTGFYGSYTPASQIIEIDSDLTKQQEEEVVIHEVLEAIDSIYDLKLDHDEQLCKLSVIIHQIITDNPHLIDYFGVERR